MAQHTVAANELAIKALRCPEGKARVVYHVDGHGHALVLLSTIFKWARATGYVDVNPADATPRYTRVATAMISAVESPLDLLSETHKRAKK